MRNTTGLHSTVIYLSLIWILIYPSTVKGQQPQLHELGEVVVTATRTPVAASDVPSAIQVISTVDIEDTVAQDLTQILKKDASSIDVIEYPGALSGISIRGFRPEFSGITKHSLVLIDGRPAGATNLSTLLLDNVERIEVLKGPASSLFGAEAVGGVVNIITRRSSGEISGDLSVEGGSFDTINGMARAGGNIVDWLDFDLTFKTRNQNDNIDLGNDHGERPGTTFNINYESLRLGSDLNKDWRLDVKGDWYKGNDIETPGALFYGDIQQSEKDLERYGGDVRLCGKWGKNQSKFVFFASKETSDYFKKYEYNYSIRGYIPTDKYHSYYKETKWWGTQLQNLYRLWGRHDITLGFDYQSIDEESKSYNKDGSRKAPWTPDSNRENWAFFSDTLWRFIDSRFIISAGIRYDYFDVETKRTPYKTDFHPGNETFDTVSPRLGLRLKFTPLFSLHSTFGKAFVPPTAYEMAGYSERLVSGTTMITMGNPDLSPETSWTWDAGITFKDSSKGLNIDLTYFTTSVNHKITRVTVGNITTYENTSEAEMAGLEMEAKCDFGRIFNLHKKIEVFFNGTRLFHSREKIEGSGWTDIHNVSHWKLNYGLNYDDGVFHGRILARYMGKRKDNDWYTPGYPVITYDSFTVVDLTFGATFMEHHNLTLKVNNLFDEYYYEKPEFPLAGRALYLEYRYEF
ncbi:TonB-dependent receptor [Dissulfuribacter thermophilus]|uniref:TonB-dependent receptor n=1 Tax=Dissulfuribacter thermophilus TaxID=1156395 RepID=UPI0008338DF2|nr:TonB-dependent receptor [Dissulfuribacter thermophilus]